MIIAIIFCFILFIVWLGCYYEALFDEEDNTTKNMAILGLGMIGLLLGVTLTIILFKIIN